jgi:hypothetical protein
LRFVVLGDCDLKYIMASYAHHSWLSRWTSYVSIRCNVASVNPVDDGTKFVESIVSINICRIIQPSWMCYAFSDRIWCFFPYHVLIPVLFSPFFRTAWPNGYVARFRSGRLWVRVPSWMCYAFSDRIWCFFSLPCTYSCAFLSFFCPLLLSLYMSYTAIFCLSTSSYFCWQVKFSKVWHVIGQTYELIMSVSFIWSKVKLSPYPP